MMMMNMDALSKNKIVLGLSGGVDSTTAALLLKEKGFEVIGFYFDTVGNNKEGVKAAEDVARQLGIEFYHKNVSKEFDYCVIDDFCRAYMDGRTPNPCVVCNPSVKFKSLIELADDVGAYYVATGHYARMSEKDGTFFVRKASNEKKDQSYMLCRLGQNVLSRLVFPLGEIDDKEKTREIARSQSLSNAETADSQEICFIDENKMDYQTFIKGRGFSSKEGNFIDITGKVLGKHKGLVNYTIGQRKGLGMTFGKPMFVLAMDKDKNTVTLGSNDQLFDKIVYSEDNFFTENGGSVIPDKYGEGLSVKAKIRYAAKASDAIMYQCEDGLVKTVFEEPQRAATPGQTIAFYDGELVIGGGFITTK